MVQKKTSVQKEVKDVILETSKDTVEQFKPLVSEISQYAVNLALLEQKKEAKEKREQAKAKKEKTKKNKPKTYEIPLRGLTHAQHRFIKSNAVKKEFGSANGYLKHIVENFPKQQQEIADLKAKIEELESVIARLKEESDFYN